jgi:hypothetical protein
LYIISVRPFPPTITVNVDSIEETKPLVVTCVTTGSRPRATLQWTIGQKDVTSNATERSTNDNIDLRNTNHIQWMLMLELNQQ